jgi:type II secretory pathway pseudopilin PulG
MVIGTLLALIVPSVMSRIDDAKLEAAIGQAMRVSKVVDLARVQITSSSTNARLQVTHSFNSLANWQTVDVVESMLSGNYKLPKNNTFGKPILVRFDEHRSYVAIDLPYSLPNYSWHPTVQIAGNTRIIISTRTAPSGTNWVSHQKRILHDETTR